MSRTYKGSSALVALVLVACAHAGSTTSQRPAGRAAQPFGWPEGLVDRSEPPQRVTITSAPGGRAGQPFGWPEKSLGTSRAVTREAPATAYLGGRAGQPFGWPEQLIAQDEAATAARQGSHPPASTAAVPARRRVD